MWMSLALGCTYQVHVHLKRFSEPQRMCEQIVLCFFFVFFFAFRFCIFFRVFFLFFFVVVFFFVFCSFWLLPSVSLRHPPCLVARMLCRHVQLQFQSLDWRNIAKHQTRHGKQKKNKKQQKKHYPQTMRKNRKNSRKKTQKKTRKKHENGTRKKHETIKIHNPGLWLVKNIIMFTFTSLAMPSPQAATCWNGSCHSTTSLCDTQSAAVSSQQLCGLRITRSFTSFSTSTARQIT